MATSQSTNAKIATFIADTEIAHQIVHGGDGATVETEGGPVDSYAKTIKELRDGVTVVTDELLAELETGVNAAADIALAAMTERTDGVADQIEADYGSLGVAVGIAQAKAESASGSVVLADAAAQRAEDAADLVQSSSSTVWRNTLALLEAVTTEPADTPGVVTDDPDPEKNGYYKYSGSAWVYTGLQPAMKSQVSALATAQVATATALAPLDAALDVQTMVHDDEGRKYALVIGDQLRMAFGALEKGGIRMKDVLLEIAGLGSKMDGAGRTWMRELADGVQFGPWKFQVSGAGLHIMDPMGRSAFTITPTGRVIIPGLVQRGASGAPVVSASGPVIQLGLHRRTGIMHIIVYGQSLSRGSTTVTPISTVQPYSNVTLAGGVLARFSDPEYDPSAFKPLVEEALPSSASNAESPTSGICNGIVRRIVGEGEAHADWRFMGSSSGQGGLTIERLSNGSGDGWFEGLKQLITDANALATLQGLTYSVWAQVLMQGEAQYASLADARSKTSFLYDVAVSDMHEALVKHIVETTGQEFRPYLVTYQTGAHRHYSRDHMAIALAQWRASRAKDNVVLAVPIYAIPHGADLLHLTREGSWLVGEYISRAIFWTMYRKAGKWRPLEPIDVDWKAGYIDVKFHVPHGPLVLDNALCALTHNMGFDIREGGVVSELITAVSVQSRDTIRLTLSAPASAGAVLTYGRGRPGDPEEGGPVTGPRGNLRDSHGDVDTATSPLGNVFPLHNPCVMFEFDRQKGF